MKKSFDCKETELSFWLEKYQAKRAKNEVDVIPFAELMLGVNNGQDVINEPKYEFSSDITHKFLNKNNIVFSDIDEDYINSIINTSMNL